jgi:hypothetical protein
MLVQIEEEMCAILTLSFVTKLSPVEVLTTVMVMGGGIPSRGKPRAILAESMATAGSS